MSICFNFYGNPPIGNAYKSIETVVETYRSPPVGKFTYGNPPTEIHL